jgi:hypothetical protein
MDESIEIIILRFYSDQGESTIIKDNLAEKTYSSTAPIIQQNDDY